MKNILDKCFLGVSTFPLLGINQALFEKRNRDKSLVLARSDNDNNVIVNFQIQLKFANENSNQTAGRSVVISDR
jgi:hypothetical protein